MLGDCSPPPESFFLLHLPPNRLAVNSTFCFCIYLQTGGLLRSGALGPLLTHTDIPQAT